MKRIEMTVASCGECPFLYDDDYYPTRCNHADGMATESLRDLYAFRDSGVPPDCPLPDAEPPALIPFILASGVPLIHNGHEYRENTIPR